MNKSSLKTATPLRQALATFPAYPFRPYFLLAAALAPLAGAVWALAAAGLWPFAAAPLEFHAYAFLNIIGGASFAGFLFTALPEWTHDARPLQRHFYATCALWLAALAAAPFATTVSAWLMLPFWLYLALFAAHLAWRARDSRQISVTVLMLAIAAADAGYAAGGGTLWLKTLAHLFAAGILLINFRIGRAIGQKALEEAGRSDCSFMPNPFYRNLSVWLVYAYAAAELLLRRPEVSAWLSLAAGLAVLGRLREWHYAVLLRRYYIRWYYLTMLATGAGYVWLGAAGILGCGSPLLPFHLIMLGGYLMMLMQVFSIAGAVHSSLKLHYPATSRLALALILAAALSRSLGVYAGLDYALAVFRLPALLLAAAFWLYLPVYWRIFRCHPPLAVQPAAKQRRSL